MISTRFPALPLLAVAALLAWPGALAAQFKDPPPPAAYALTDVTVVRADGTRLEGVNLVIRGGMIEALGAEVAVPPDAKVLEGDSLFVYPGFIDADGAATYVFPEVEVDPSTIGSWNPPRHVQSYMPHRRIVDYLTATGSSLADQRKQGVVAAAVHPAGRLMPGRGTLLVFRRDAETPDALVVQPALGPVMSLQGAQRVYPRALFGVIAFYRQKFEDAKHLSAHIGAFERDPRGLETPAWDPDLDVLREAMAGQGPVFFAADLARDIQRVLKLAREYNFRPMIVGGDEAWKVADQLKAQNVPVLVSLDFPKPERWKPDKEKKKEGEEEEPVADGGQPVAESDPAAQEEEEEEEEEEELDAGALREKQRIEDIYSNAGRLSAAGVSFALTSGSGKADMVEGARKAIEYGLSEEAALAAMTVTPASLLGVPQMAELAPRRPANLVVADAPLFDEDTKIRYTFVEGALEEGSKKKKPESDEAPVVDMTGVWNMTLEGERGRFEWKVTLEQEGAVFDGTSVSDRGESTVKDGTISGNSITFTVVVQFGDRTRELQFTGTVEGDTASGSAEGPRGSMSWTAKRASGPQEGQR